MEFRALIEKLDWKGDVVRTVKTYEDEGFKPDMTRFLREAIETGEIKTKDFPTPKWTWDHSMHDLLIRIAGAKSQYSFRETEPGLRLVAGDFYPALDAQFILLDDKYRRDGWIKTDHDVIAEAEHGA